MPRVPTARPLQVPNVAHTYLAAVAHHVANSNVYLLKSTHMDRPCKSSSVAFLKIIARSAREKTFDGDPNQRDHDTVHAKPRSTASGAHHHRSTLPATTDRQSTPLWGNVRQHLTDWLLTMQDRTQENRNAIPCEYDRYQALRAPNEHKLLHVMEPNMRRAKLQRASQSWGKHTHRNDHGVS